MIDLSELFPRALSKPISLSVALNNLTGNDFMPAISEKHSYPKLIKSLKPGESIGKRFGKGFNWIRCHPNRPCPTIPKSVTYGGLGLLFLPDASRSLSARELGRCASYPDSFEWIGNYSEAVARIGNSVPPMLIRAIALQIKYILWEGYKLNPYPKEMTYLDILESAWQDHLKPKEPNALTVISTFAGGGGSSLGYSMAGYRELLAVEWDDNAVATFKLNFPDVPVYHGDIAKLSVEECMRLAGVKEGELDLLDGSPPCQGFSTAGKRILDDPRNQLFREYIRLLRGLKPKVFVMENVSGMVKGKMKLIFAEVMRELKASGYRVSARLMNAMYFYVPQSRERMIFIGVREDLGIEPGHPKAESKPVIIEEAWNGCEIGELGNLSPAISKVIPYIPVYGDGGDVTGKLFFSTKRLAWNKPARTLNKDMIGSRSAMIHPKENRTIGIGEAKRISSFPDNFQFKGGYKDIIPRIGNSVPPLFMRSIANHIKGKILVNKKAPVMGL